jgi:hypothetical protein
MNEVKKEVVRIMADRLQRFIPDRENAEGMADALVEDLRAEKFGIVEDFFGPPQIQCITSCTTT